MTRFDTAADEAGLTGDAFLGGRLSILQPAAGFRAGLDSVLLAAAVAAQSGETVFEAGVGPGVAALCLAARCPDVRVEGVERDPALAALALRNAARNGLENRIFVEPGDITGPCPPDQANRFPQTMANPPFFDPARATAPPHPAKAGAHMAAPGELALWIKGCAARLVEGGLLTLIFPAAGLGDLTAALTPRLGGITVFPLWPGRAKPAKRLIVTGRKGSAAPLRLLPGLILHDGSGFTPEAEAILRHAAPLDLT